MSKVILHNGRSGSTYLYLVLDRYYRAAHGDNQEGCFENVYDREYDLQKNKYLGLNEFLVPELLDASFDNNLLCLKGVPRLKGTVGLLKSIENTDEKTKKERRDFVTTHLKSHLILLKYPLLSNPPPKWDVDYISCERRDLRKQTISLYLSMTTGYYHFKKGDKRVERLKRFFPEEDIINVWMKYVKKNNTKYRALKPKTAQTVFMEDFEDLKPFEVLEMVGIMDWNKYLDKEFDVPIRKGWHSPTKETNEKVHLEWRNHWSEVFLKMR